MDTTDTFLINLKDSINIVKGMNPIVVVDDDPDFRYTLQKCYEKSQKKNELILIGSGDELLKYMGDVLSQKTKMPEVIFLDINMPGLNGFESLEQIRSHDEFKKIPVVIMLTASSAKEDIAKAQELGANGFWTKSLYIKDYVALFEKI